MIHTQSEINRLKERLVDAQDGKLDELETEQLRRDVMAADPKLWEDHCWMLAESLDRGLIRELSSYGREEPPEDAVSRFLYRRASGKNSGSEIQELAVVWFRRYVLAAAMAFLLFFGGLHLWKGPAEPYTVAEELEDYMGWHLAEIPRLDHWLYDDF